MNKSGKKTKLVAGLLCWFLGVFGAHRFYLGHKRSGFWMILLTILGFVGTGITAATASQRYPDEVMLVIGSLLTLCLSVVGVWVLVDLICILTGRLAPVGGYDALMPKTVEWNTKPQIHPVFVDANAGMTVLEKYHKLYRKGALSKREYEETVAEFLSRM